MTQLDAMARRTLYALKREYGGPIDLYKLVDSQTDPRTGQKTVQTRVWHVRRSIILPKLLARQIARANREFPGGGTYDAGTREFIVDCRDVPGLVTLTADDWIVDRGVKYQIKTVESFDLGWLITAKELVGEVPQQTFDVQVDHRLGLSSTVEEA